MPQYLINPSFNVIVGDYSVPVSSVFMLVSRYVMKGSLFCFATVNFGCSYFLFRSTLPEVVVAVFFSSTSPQTLSNCKKTNCLNI